MVAEKTEVLSLRMNSNLKHKAAECASAIGLPLSTAVNIMITRFVADRGFSYPVVAPEIPNAETLAAIKEGQEAYERGEAKEQDPEEFLAEMGIKA